MKPKGIFIILCAIIGGAIMNGLPGLIIGGLFGKAAEDSFSS